MPLSKGTAEIANREVPTNRHKSLGPENALHFRDDQETCKFAGNTNGTGGSHLCKLLILNMAVLPVYSEPLSAWHFPANREFNREISKFGLSFAHVTRTCCTIHGT